MLRCPVLRWLILRWPVLGWTVRGTGWRPLFQESWLHARWWFLPACYRPATGRNRRFTPRATVSEKFTCLAAGYLAPVSSRPSNPHRIAADSPPSPDSTPGRSAEGSHQGFTDPRRPVVGQVSFTRHLGVGRTEQKIDDDTQIGPRVQPPGVNL